MSRLPDAGNVSPSFTLMDLAEISCDFGQTFDHPAYLLFFVKKDCETCTLVAPVVEQIHQTLSAHGLKVLTISQSNKVDTQKFIKDTGLTTTILLDQNLYVSDDYGFDAEHNQYGSMYELGIIDPVKVTRSALENAGSIAGMILTTESILTEYNPPKLPAPFDD